MPLDFDFGDIPLSGSDFWIWFQFTGSLLVWLVTFGQIWLMNDHEHWAGFVGLMLHVAVIGGVLYAQKTNDSPKESQNAKQVTVSPAFLSV
jgi:hypothetical protein